MKPDKVVKTALCSLVTNFGYGLYTGIIGITSRSWWFVTLAAYYMVLSMVRFAILLSSRKPAEGAAADAFIMRFTGAMFIFLSIVLAGTAYLSVKVEQGVRHHEIVMITMALYAFTKITLAIINLIKVRKNPSPILNTLRSISFAEALVSIFSLQRSMLVSFGDLSANEIRIFHILTGSGVYLFVFLMGLHPIGGKTVIMAESKFVKANEKIAEAVVDGYKKIEKGVVTGYKKVEDSVVEGYGKVEDRFIAQFLTRENETLEEAKARLKHTPEE